MSGLAILALCSFFLLPKPFLQSLLSAKQKFRCTFLTGFIDLASVFEAPRYFLCFHVQGQR